MAGFFYYMAMVLAGGPLYVQEAPGTVFLSMFCHGSIYLYGFVTVGTEKCDVRDAPKLALGVVLLVINAVLLRPLAEGGGRLLIYILLDAVVVRRMLPSGLWAAALPAYYFTVTVLVLLTIRGFFGKSQRQYRKFSAGQAA